MYILLMTLQGQMFERAAVCTARVAANNYFSVRQQDIDTTNLEAGDNVRVRLTAPDLESNVQPRDSDIYDSTLQKSNQVYIPKDTREKLDLDTGDVVKYIVIPTKSFPGLKDGPVREKARSVVNGEDEEEEEQEFEERPERDTTSSTFSDSSMQKTGQITVPAQVVDDMALVKGDQVLTTIKWQGEDITVPKDLGTGNRLTINKEEREELGLEPGDEPTIRIAIFN